MTAHDDDIAWATAEAKKLDRNAPRRPLSEFMAERRKARKTRLFVQVLLRLPEMVRTMRSAR